MRQLCVCRAKTPSTPKYKLLYIFQKNLEIFRNLPQQLASYVLELHYEFNCIAKSKSFSGLFEDNQVFSHFPRSSVCLIILEYLVRKYKQPKSSHFYFMIIVYTCISRLGLLCEKQLKCKLFNLHCIFQNCVFCLGMKCSTVH